MDKETINKIYYNPLSISEFMRELYNHFPKYKFIYTEDKNWYTVKVNNKHTYIITKRSLRNKDVGYKRLKVVINDIKRGDRYGF